MGYMDSTQSTIVSLLTTLGRKVLARNDGSFRIVKFKIGDDEINYQLYNPGNIDSEDSDIMSLPILEPCSNPDAALRFPLVTLPEGTKRVSEIKLSPSNVALNLSKLSERFNITVNTLYNFDGQYLVGFNNVNLNLINSLSVVQNTSVYLVNDQSSETNYEYIVQATSNIQSSVSNFGVLVTFKQTKGPGIVNPIETDVTGINEPTLPTPVNNTSYLLFTMIVQGRESGAFTTMDIYGTAGGRTVGPNPPTNNPIMNNDNSSVAIGGAA